MLGLKGSSHVTLEYFCELMREYKALDSAQIFIMLKRYSGFTRKQRIRFCTRLCDAQYARKTQIGERYYFILRPNIRVEGQLLQQIKCFWVLLDYMDHADRHYATGTPGCLISMEIDGRDYSILYVEKGKEKACSYQMERGGVTRYFVLVEDMSQIPLIKGDQIHAFAMLDEKNTVHYYKNQGG